MRRALLVTLLVASALAAAPAAAERPPDFSLLRVDLEDGFALHPWLYHEFRISEHWGILVDAHAQAPGLNSRFPPYLEVDVGPVLHVGPLQINPQIGTTVTWRSKVDAATGRDEGHSRGGELLLQLYLILNWKRLAAESWNLYYIPFDGDEPQFFQLRDLVTVRVAWGLALGPHFEATFIRGVGADRLAVGGDLSYTFRWGQLVLFLASERERGVLETRLTFLREL